MFFWKDRECSFECMLIFIEIIAYSVELIISDYYMPTSLIVSRDPTVICLAILKYRSQHEENAYTHILYTLPTK